MTTTYHDDDNGDDCKKPKHDCCECHNDCNGNGNGDDDEDDSQFGLDNFQILNTDDGPIIYPGLKDTVTYEEMQPIIGLHAFVNGEPAKIVGVLQFGDRFFADADGPFATPSYPRETLSILDAPIEPPAVEQLSAAHMPEPSSLGLLLMGLVALGMARRR